MIIDRRFLCTLVLSVCADLHHSAVRLPNHFYTGATSVIRWQLDGWLSVDSWLIMADASDHCSRSCLF